MYIVLVSLGTSLVESYVYEPVSPIGIRSKHIDLHQDDQEI